MTDQSPSTTIDGAELRACLGRFATGVTVVTYRDGDGKPRGATMNAFTSVSLDPPLVLISVARTVRRARCSRTSHSASTPRRRPAPTPS